MKLCAKFFYTAVLLLLSTHVYGDEVHTKQWTVATMIGSFPQNEKCKYYIEPQLRLIDNRYVFNQAFLLTALGYQFTPNIILFIGPGVIATKNNEGDTFREYRLFEQLNWQLVDNSCFKLNSRTRFEQKKRSDQPQAALQLRQRLWLRIPIRNTNKYYISLYDEVFFNLNNPRWVSPRFFEQNRAFLGIAKQITKETMVDFGYLNQKQFGPPSQTSHVILLSFNMNFD